MSPLLTGIVAGLLVGAVIAAALCCFYNRRKNLKSQAGKISELEELSRITGGLAHEIKNPLSIIKVNLKLVSEDLTGQNENVTPVPAQPQVQARAAKKIAVVRKETERLEEILEDFLRYIKKTELHSFFSRYKPDSNGYD